MPKGYNLLDSVFGKLIVVDREGSNAHNMKTWYCLCECGQTRIATTTQLNQGLVTACQDCSRLAPDITGIKHNRLTPLERTKINGRQAWVCKCDCGNYHTVRHTSLVKGLTKSCGCLRSETSRKAMNKLHAEGKVPNQQWKNNPYHKFGKDYNEPYKGIPARQITQ